MIELDDGTTEVTRPLAPGVLRTTGSYDDEFGGGGYIVDAAQGIYLLMYLDTSEGADYRTTYAFEMPPAEMPPLTAGAQLSLPVISVDIGFEAGISPDVHYVTAGTPYELTIGACTLSAIDVTYTYESDPATAESYIYMPDLGFAFLAGWLDADGTEQALRPISIGVAQ